MVKYLAKGYLWALLLLLYSPILIIMIFSFTEAKVLGNWTGFSTKLYSSLFAGNVQHSLVSALWNTFAIAMIAATVSTLLGSVAAIGIFNLKAPVVVEDQSITTAGKQKLVIDRKELDKMSGKRVLVVDDVISTGGSLKALDELAEQTQCTIVGQAAVLAEGDAAQRKDIIFLEPLPLFLH